MKQQSISQWKLVNTRSSALYLSQVFHQISPQLVSKSWLVPHFISLERFILCFYRIYGKILGFSRTVNLRNSCWPAAYHINTFHTEVFLSFSKALKLRFSISCKYFNEKCNFSTYWHFDNTESNDLINCAMRHGWVFCTYDKATSRNQNYISHYHIIILYITYWHFDNTKSNDLTNWVMWPLVGIYYILSNTYMVRKPPQNLNLN